MHTYKTTEGWDSSTWPEENNESADITQWHYHESSGLLESKQDALGQTTSYTYHEAGRPATRT